VSRLRTSCAQRVATLILIASLVSSSGGYMLCVKAEGGAAVGLGNFLIGCMDQCEFSGSGQTDSCLESATCVDYLISGLVTVRSDCAETKNVPPPVLVTFVTSWTAVFSPALWERSLSRSEPPDRETTASIRSTILII